MRNDGSLPEPDGVVLVLFWKNRTIGARYLDGVFLVIITSLMEMRWCTKRKRNGIYNYYFKG